MRTKKYILLEITAYYTTLLQKSQEFTLNEQKNKACFNFFIASAEVYLPPGEFRINEREYRRQTLLPLQLRHQRPW